MDAVHAKDEEKSFLTKSGCYTPGGAIKKIGDKTNSFEKTTPQLPRKSQIEGVSKFPESEL